MLFVIAIAVQSSHMPRDGAGRRDSPTSGGDQVIRLSSAVI